METRWQNNLRKYYGCKGEMAEKHDVNAVLIFDMGKYHQILFNDAVYCSKTFGLEMRVFGSVENKKISICIVKNDDIKNVTEKLIDKGRTVGICSSEKKGDSVKPKLDSQNVIDFLAFRIRSESRDNCGPFD